MTAYGATPSQTVGPFFAFGLPYPDGPRVVPEWRADAIRLRGRVTDGEGAPVPDAMIEIMQADTAGRIPRAVGALRRDGADFSGFGRCDTDPAGNYWFTTLRPGQVGGAAPYIAMLVFARGLLKPVATRVYLPEEQAANTADPLLSAVPTDRRGTLVAVAEGNGSYRFDIRLQGAGETVFLAV
jgi:protocatechuate 3,4-dioxygenase alpha subunit